MATPVQRMQSIADAIINGVATPAQVNRLGAALAASALRTAEYNAATNAGKATIALEVFRQRILQVVRNYEGEQAVVTAQTTASAQVDTDFAAAP